MPACQNPDASSLHPHPLKIADGGCISLIGMAGVGKSTVGRQLALRLDWPHLDTDRLLEAYYGKPLQSIFDALGLQDFLQAEETVVANLGAKRCVISTGGSVVYGSSAVEKLRALGPVIHLDATSETIERRIDDLDQRGLAMAPGQTLAMLHAERAPLYAKAATKVIHTDDISPEDCVEQILAWLQEAE